MFLDPEGEDAEVTIQELADLKQAIENDTLEKFCPGDGVVKTGIEMPADGVERTVEPR